MASKLFEVGDVLPIGQINISWNITRSAKGDDIFYINGSNGFSIESAEFGGFNLTINGIFDYFDNPDNCIITLTNSTTIQSIDSMLDGYFSWEVIPSGYSITFEENGGTSVTDLTEQTNLPNPLPTPTKDGHVFVTWYLDSMFTQKAVAGATIESNVTLYAKWHNPTSWVTEIADSIREKEGTSAPIKKVDFPDRIKNIQGAKEEETKTLTPNFESGNVVVTPTSGKVLSQVELVKPTDLTPENIAKDKNVCGVVGTLESGGGGSPIYEYTLNVTTTYIVDESYDSVYLTIVFGKKSDKTIIDNKDYYPYYSSTYATYELDYVGASPYTANDGFDMYRLFWDRDLFNGNTSFKIKSYYNPEIYECLGIYCAIGIVNDHATLSMNGAVTYSQAKNSPLPISNESIINSSYISLFHSFHSGRVELFRDGYANAKFYYPKLSNQTLEVYYID